MISQLNEKSKIISTNCLIALCETENYNAFCKELEELIKSDKGENLIYKMYNIMRGKFTIGNKKYKEFVKKYKDIIEIMKKNQCLSDMTIMKYDNFGENIPSTTEDYFFKFITDHKSDIETIKNIAIKIKNLGFSQINYDKNFDFNTTEYELNRTSSINYLENIEIIPTYNNYSIQYNTKNSCYCIELDTYGYGDTRKISDYGRSIYLNSLIFDPNRLPNEITTESTIGFITKLANENKQDGKTIKDLVDTSVAIDDLIIQYNQVIKTIETIKNTKTKEELKQILNNILEEINKLKLINQSYEQEKINNSLKLSNSTIEKEKQLYLESRNKSIHDCW